METADNFTVIVVQHYMIFGGTEAQLGANEKTRNCALALHDFWWH
ncbi:MAG: hypothetical protein SWJ54_23520 [Cyanobacteriota bacterium]|nr:hypothetical protein [Cyanobacteriota bacterium]